MELLLFGIVQNSFTIVELLLQAVQNLKVRLKLTGQIAGRNQ